MKKYILAVVFAFGFALNTNAQESKSTESTTVTTDLNSYHTNAKSDLNDVKSFTSLTPEFEKIVLDLFIAKHKMLFNASNEEVKATIRQGIESKLVSAIGIDKVNQIKANTVLFEKLMN